MGAVLIYPAAKVPTLNGLPKALVSWSSGKDSAWALHVLRERGEVQVVGLLTTVNEAFRRVAMHAVRTELLRAQAEAVGLPLWEVEIPHPCSNEQYEAAMSQAMAHARREGVTHVAFGDLFLDDAPVQHPGRTQGGSGVTRTGEYLSVVVPSPSWPSEFSPQHQIASATRAQL